VQYVLMDAEANVICPATKLWNTGHGANMMREAVSLMGGYGITEDCPGFLANKWMDAQLEATYEGPEAVQRRQLTVTMTSEVFLAQFRAWIAGDARIASTRPGTGACTLASAMRPVAVDAEPSAKATDPTGNKLYHGQRQGVTFALADALCWLVASRCQILDVLELEARGPEPIQSPPKAWKAPCSSSATSATRRRRGGRRGLAHLRRAGLRLQPAPLLGRRGSTALLPGQRTGRATKRPCPASRPLPSMCWRRRQPSAEGRPLRGCAGSSEFLRLQSKLTTCLSGSRLAKDRAAETVSKVMIPEALDYPA
jgi:hypothetical protein